MNPLKGVAVFLIPLSILVGTVGYVHYESLPKTEPAKLAEVAPIEPEPICTTDNGRLFNYINAERTSLNVNSLTVDPTLTMTSKQKMDDMITNTYFGHENLTGGRMDTLLRPAGVRAAISENLGINANNADEDWEAFKASPNHYSSLINRTYTRIGISSGCTNYVMTRSTGPNDNSHLIGSNIKQLTVIHLAGPEPARAIVRPVYNAAAGCPITTCNDGSCSSSTGRGTCSWHGGIAY